MLVTGIAIGQWMVSGSHSHDAQARRREEEERERRLLEEEMERQAERERELAKASALLKGVVARSGVGLGLLPLEVLLLMHGLPKGVHGRVR